MNHYLKEGIFLKTKDNNVLRVLDVSDKTVKLSNVKSNCCVYYTPDSILEYLRLGKWCFIHWGTNPTLHPEECHVGQLCIKPESKKFRVYIVIKLYEYEIHLKQVSNRGKITILSFKNFNGLIFPKN